MTELLKRMADIFDRTLWKNSANWSLGFILIPHYALLWDCNRVKNLNRWAMIKRLLSVIRHFGILVQRVNMTTIVAPPVELSNEVMRLVSEVETRAYSSSSKQRLYATALACQYAIQNEVQGDFVECGTWRGGHAIIARGVFDSYGNNRKVWIFDTFSGMSSPSEFDLDLNGKSAATEFVKYAENMPEDENDWRHAGIVEVKKNFTSLGLEIDTVKFVQGMVEKTLLSNHLPGSIAVLRLDTDWYESTKIELEVLYPLLSPGGVLIIDDYGHWKGCRKAVDEYFVDVQRPFLQYIDYTCRSGVKQGS